MLRKLLFGITFVLILLGAAVAVVVVRPTGAPDYASEPPALSAEGHVTYTAEAMMVMAPAEFRNWQQQNELVTFLKPTGSIPGVVGTEMMEGEWLSAGAKRRVLLEGGHMAVERIIESTPNLLRYQVWGFTTPARYLVHHAEGEIRYVPESDRGTRVIWTYKMMPRAFFTEPFLAAFMRNEFGPFMTRGLNDMAAANAKAMLR